MPTALHWSDLQFFLAVCAQGSVGAAAQALGVNHSTVLRRIASLERSLAVRLFDRLPSGYVLTVRGQELVAQTAGVAEQLEAAQRRVAGGDLQLSGTIRLTAPDTLLRAVLLPHLARFRALHPQVVLELVINNRFLNLTRREADVAVRGSNRPPENLVGRRVGKVQTALYAATAYLDSIGRARADAAPADADLPEASVHDANLPDADLHWIGHAEPLAHLGSAQWIARHVAPERVVLRVDSLITLADAVAAGFGAGWLLCPLAAARPGLERLRAPPPEFDTQVWILTHPDLKRVARIRALTDFLHEALTTDPQLAHG